MGSGGDEGTKHYNIGENLRHKAFYEDSIDELSRALHLQEGELGPNDIAVAKTHYSLGLAFRATREFKQGMQHLTKAAEIFEANDKVQYQQQIKNSKLNLARTHHSYGVELQRGGNYDRSIIEHRKALAIREAILGRSHLETARSYYVMGCALSDNGNFDEALGDLRRALRTRVMVFGKEHIDTIEVVDNIGTVLYAKGTLNAEGIAEYKTVVLQSLEFENQGDICCRKQEYDNGMVCYRKGLALEEACLGELHPTACDLYLRMADALGEIGDLEASLIEYKCAITIYERMLGRFHVKMANIYTKLAGILMDKGEYEGALSFYCKAYGIYDATLGLHDDTKQALMNVKLAAEKDRGAKSSMDILVKVEAEFKKRHPSIAGEGPKKEDTSNDEDDEEAEEENQGMKDSNGQTKKKKKKKRDGEKKKKAAGKENSNPGSLEDEFDII